MKGIECIISFVITKSKKTLNTKFFGKFSKIVFNGFFFGGGEGVRKKVGRVREE